jgi:hypothetical protein
VQPHPPRSGAQLASRELWILVVVVMNALGMGKIVGQTEMKTKSGQLEKGYLLTLASRSEQAFCPFSRAASLLHSPVDEPTARAMLASILEAHAAPSEPDNESRLRRSVELWQNGTHPEQARYLGQLLAGGPPGNVALIIGFNHLLYEISYVLHTPIADLDAQVQQRFPWLKSVMPPR